jgi:nucleoside-diphosphate-sugar epimerase
MLAGEGVVINGDGHYLRDYVYAGDVARANALALERDLAEPFTAFNIGTAIATDVNQLEEQMRTACIEVARRTGRRIEVPVPRHGPHRAGDLRSSLVSSKKAAELLGWQPTTLLADGLRQTIDWFAATARE